MRTFGSTWETPQDNDVVSEELPEHVICCKLMNGSKIYYRQCRPNEILLESSEKISDDLLPALPMKFAGELDNKLYFYTLWESSGNVKTKNYTFYKLCTDDTALRASIDLKEIGRLTTEKDIKFALQQPYFLDYVEGVPTFENFERNHQIELTRRNAEFITGIDTGPAIIVRRNHKGTVTTVLRETFHDQQLCVISVHQDLPPPTSFYAQDESSLYMLCGTTLLVFKENFKFSRYEIDHPSCQIGGVERQRLFLNAHRLFFSHDLHDMEYNRWKEEEKFHRLNLALKRLILQEENNYNENVRFSSRFQEDYDIKEILGIGGGGCVFGAVNKYDDEKYAVKRIAVDPRNKSKELWDEVHAMKKLEHPGIVRYHSTWGEEPPAGWQHDVDGKLLEKINSDKMELLRYKQNSIFIYIQMQCCEFSLTHWLKENNDAKSRPLILMKSFFKQIVNAVEYLHAKNFIHRDLKPCNILFYEDNRLKICDMGIVVKRTINDDGEEITRNCDPQLNSKSDVFTLGLIFTELCLALSYKSKIKIFDNYRNGNLNDIFGQDIATATFISQLTNTDPHLRPSCQEILEDRYMQESNC